MLTTLNVINNIELTIITKNKNTLPLFNRYASKKLNLPISKNALVIPHRKHSL